MRFIVDVCTDVGVVTHLRRHGHDVTRVGWDYPGDIEDSDILSISVREGRTLITEDRDFGDLVVRLGSPHAGVIYFRLGSAMIGLRLSRLDEVVAQYADRLDHFLVVGRKSVRVLAK